MYANQFLWRREKGRGVVWLECLLSQNDSSILALSSQNNEGYDLKESFSLFGWPTKTVTTANSQWKESVLFLLTDKCSQYSQNKQWFFIVSVKRMMNVHRAIRRGIYRGDRATGTCLGEKWAVIWGRGKWLQRGLLSRKWSSFSVLINFTIRRAVLPL